MGNFRLLQISEGLEASFSELKNVVNNGEDSRQYSEIFKQLHEKFSELRGATDDTNFDSLKLSKHGNLNARVVVATFYQIMEQVDRGVLELASLDNKTMKNIAMQLLSVREIVLDWTAYDDIKGPGAFRYAREQGIMPFDEPEKVKYIAVAPETTLADIEEFIEAAKAEGLNMSDTTFTDALKFLDSKKGMGLK